MATSNFSSIRFEIDGKKHLLKLDHSRSAAELRIILSEQYHISSNTVFLDAEGCILFPGDEQTTTISELLTENNFVRLTTDERKLTPIPILESKNTISERKDDLKYDQSLSQSTKTSLRELKLPDSTTTNSQNKVVVPTDLDRNMWEKIFINCNLFYGIRMDEETPKHGFKYIFQFKESNSNILPFHVTNDSRIDAYIKDKEMETSFISSTFFDGGLEFSSPLIGIGINPEYSKSKAMTNTEQTFYLTFCFNYPRVTLELDSSYFEPTPQFIEEIDNVLSTLTLDEQIIKLEKVLSTYGHVYPHSVVLGGQLYHTEVHHNIEKAEEAKKRICAETSSSTSSIQPAKIHVGGEFDKQLQNKLSEQTSLLNFKAVGGDTQLNCDPTLWISSVADPFLWRVIEQDNYQSVITLLDQQRQRKLQRIFSYHTKKKMIGNINYKWKQFGITVAGGNGQGNQLNQLSRPQGIFIDDDLTIYIADRGNDRIVEWKCNAKNGQILAGENGQGDQMNQFNLPSNVIIDKENNSFIISDWGDSRIIQWSRQNNTNEQIIISNIDCWGLTMDKNGYLYVSDCEKNEVRRYKIGDEHGTIVAGGNGRGNDLNQLNWPTYIFIDEDYSLYVSDCGNDRVMKWIKDAKEGIAIAGGNGQGNSLTQLSCPRGVIVDQLGQIYVADCGNDRVMCWCIGVKEGTIVVGGNGRGEQLNQLNQPEGLSLDREGNLYVVDCWNNRIQKFEIDENQSCFI